MSIAEFIRDSVMRPRLKQAGCLVVYDPGHRYRELCADFASDKVRVVDASTSSIESREAALLAIREVGQPGQALEGLLVYVPSKKPTTDEQKQSDPFAVYAEVGAVFPDGDGDEYLSLCLRARPDHGTEIRQVFTSTGGAPSFAVIDAIGGGVSWPQLRTALDLESGREILEALLAPNADQAKALKGHKGWDQEARQFLQTTLGMQVKTKGKSWDALAEELWRFVLFSEFLFDLPAAPPESLAEVPRAPHEARPIVEDVCDTLRNNPKCRSTYIERAEQIEGDLGLADACMGIEDLGLRDTFPFEERSFLRTAIKAIGKGDTDSVRSILARRTSSVWIGKGDSQAQWALVGAGLNLVEVCDDLERQLAEHTRTQAGLVDFYLGTLREGDRLQRAFEQSVGDFIDQHGLMDDVIHQARARYRQLSDKVQSAFMRHLEASGWPPAGRFANVDVFDRLVGVRIQERGHKVAYLMVDALRYELGVELSKSLPDDWPVDLQASYAQLPSITPVGMASLLPGAGTELTLTIEGDSLVPKMAGVATTNVSQRMELLRKRLGDRFAEMTLNDFTKKKPKIASTVDLIVLRSSEIDSQLETNPETTLGLIPHTLQLIRRALDKLRGMGFREAVIVTDHGFFLNSHAEAGDVCAKPQGLWRVSAHDRMLLGTGTGDSNSIVLPANKVGIRGDVAQVAMPKSMAPYSAGHLYFHGGASLAEAVVPVLIVRLDAGEEPGTRKAVVTLTYKNKATRVTTRIPVVDVVLEPDDLFAQATGIEVLLEAQDSKGNVVGEPRPGPDVNAATRTVALLPGERMSIAMRMDEEFRGKLTIKALNPTTLVSYGSLALETDYLE